MKHAPGFLHLVEARRQLVTEVEPAQIAGRLPPHEHGYDLLDVREDSEWAAGHIAGARHLGKGILERDIEAQIPDREREIVLYCGGGYRSVLAADALQSMGYRKVRSLIGGYRTWTERGLPIEGAGWGAAPDSPQPERSSSMIPKHIVVATDLGENSLPALRAARDLAGQLGARLTVVYVIEPTPTPPGLEGFALEGMPVDWEQRLSRGRQEAVQARLDELLVAEAAPGVSMQSRVVFGLLPGALVDSARDLLADLLVVGTHGRSGVAHFFLGSVAERVVRHAHCPVLIVRPH